MALEKFDAAGTAPKAKFAGSMKKHPTMIRRTRGVILAKVNMFVVNVTSRTPITLTLATASVMAQTAAGRAGPAASDGQKRLRYPSRMLVLAANAVTRAIHISHPIVNPTAGPNASRAYR
ncbi:MAG: hypothetical protein IANPNBLG_03379 [Bryobacteraceae bacterium]|nr:hypothetical protein [Bryobacteraceae bacterium]